MRLISISVQIVLIAVAIQGFTPDPHTVASTNRLRLLGPNTDSSHPFENQEDSTDYVIGPVQYSEISALLGLVDDTPALGFVSAGSHARTTKFSAVGFEPNRVSWIDSWIRLLCRLAWIPMGPDPATAGKYCLISGLGLHLIVMVTGQTCVPL